MISNLFSVSDCTSHTNKTIFSCLRNRKIITVVTVFLFQLMPDKLQWKPLNGITETN